MVHKMVTVKPYNHINGAHALLAGLAILYARMRVHKPTRPSTHMHARANMHTQTNK